MVLFGVEEWCGRVVLNLLPHEIIMDKSTQAVFALEVQFRKVPIFSRRYTERFIDALCV